MVILQKHLKSFEAMLKQLQVPRAALLTAVQPYQYCTEVNKKTKLFPSDGRKFLGMFRNHQGSWACTPVSLSTVKPVLYHLGVWENQERSPWSKRDTFNLDKSNVFCRNVLWSDEAKAKFFLTQWQEAHQTRMSFLNKKIHYQLPSMASCWGYNYFI